MADTGGVEEEDCPITPPGPAIDHVDGDCHMRNFATYINDSGHDFSESILSKASDLFTEVRQFRSRQKKPRKQQVMTSFFSSPSADTGT